MKLSAKHLVVRAIHVGVHHGTNANAGDTALYIATRRLFEQYLSIDEWYLQPSWDNFDQSMVKLANAKYDFLLVGGGGMLLRDQQGASTAASGWQWNISVNNLRELDIPIIVFAIGYNRFRGQPDFDPPFSEHINLLASKSIFFGLRNYGSIHKLSIYLDPTLVKTLSFQPCPTTVLGSHNLVPNDLPTDLSQPIVAFNYGSDRTSTRFTSPEQLEFFLGSICSALQEASSLGFTVHLANHKPDDSVVASELTARGIDFKIIDLYKSTYEDICNYYRNISAVLAMRGHSQMIPFGLDKPVFTLVSHPKMQYFVEDFNLKEYSAEVSSPDLKNKVCSFLYNVARRDSKLSDLFLDAREAALYQTRQNMTELCSRLG